jgi:hypothetical protein
VRAGRWYDVFWSTVIGQIAGRLACRGPSVYCGRTLSAGFGLATWLRGYCQEIASVARRRRRSKHLRAPDHQLHSTPRRHTTTATSHSSAAASPLQYRHRSHRASPHRSTDKHPLDPGTPPANLPYLKETQRRRPGTNRARDTNTATLISLEQILHAAFPPETLRRTAHHDFSQTPRQYRQSVFHSPPARRHLLRRECEPVAAQLRPVRREKDG